MKLTVDGDTLTKSLARLRGPTGGIGTERLIRASADNGFLSMAANNMFIQTEVRIEGHGEGKADFCVDLADFLAVSKQSPKNSEILLEHDGKELVVTRARGQSRLETVSGDIIPLWNDIVDGLPCMLDGALLREILLRVLHCVPTDAHIAQLNCAFLTTLPNGGTRVVATDGHRLAMYESDSLRSSLPAPGILIPPTTLKEIIRIAQDGEPVTVSAGKSAACFSAGPETITTKLIEGHYPDYMRVVLFNPEIAVRLPRFSFLEATQNIDALLTGSKLSKLVLDENGAHLETSRDRLTSSESFDVNEHHGLPATGFNSGYLLEALKAFRGSEVLLEYSGTAADRIRLSDPDDGKLVQIIMPMRI